MYNEHRLIIDVFPCVSYWCIACFDVAARYTTDPRNLLLRCDGKDRAASTYALKQRQCYPSDLHHLSVMICDDYVPEAHVRLVKWWQSFYVRSHQKGPVLGSPKSHFTFSPGPCYETDGGQYVQARVTKHWMTWSPKRLGRRQWHKKFVLRVGGWIPKA